MQSTGKHLFRIRQLVRTSALTVAFMFACAPYGPTEELNKGIPSFSVVQKVVLDQMKKNDEWQSGDIISKSDIQGISEKLNEIGWQVGKWQKIEAAVLDDNQYLVQKLRTKAGRRFMRRISHYPLAYDRLDQVIVMENGKMVLDDLIRWRKGYEYVDVPHGPGFDRITELLPIPKERKRKLPQRLKQPTGKIYTATSLVDVLKELHISATQ